ncbi:MAG: hypothetical protein PHR28_01710 [candidate division Zixibacteria bacterium]|nr:hypothetical protein [candidate division Zixibacteria bacterium]
MDEQLPLREATLGDLPVLVRHRRMMFVDMGPAEGKEATAADLARMDTAYAEHLRRQMSADILHAWVIDSPDGIVASGVLSIMSWPPKPGDTTGRGIYESIGFRPWDTFMRLHIE